MTEGAGPSGLGSRGLGGSGYERYGLSPPSPPGPSQPRRSSLGTQPTLHRAPPPQRYATKARSYSANQPGPPLPRPRLLTSWGTPLPAYFGEPERSRSPVGRFSGPVKHPHPLYRKHRYQRTRSADVYPASDVSAAGLSSPYRVHVSFLIQAS